MGTLEVVVGDITKLDVDVIVNAANETLLGGGGVDGAIHRAAGSELLAACKSLTEVRPGVRCPTGEVRLTLGFALLARWVVHTVGPVWRDGMHGESALLGACYQRSLELAAAQGARSIALPAISTGAYRFPSSLAGRIASERCAEFLRRKSSVERVVLVAFSEPAAATLRLEVRDVTRPPARRSDWKTTPLPEARARLCVDQTYSRTQYEWLRHGVVPREMEDRWFVFFEEPWLYLHRSWTGICVFQVKLEPHGEGARIAEAWVTRKPDDYLLLKDAEQAQDAHDAQLVLNLLRGWAR